MKGAVLGRSKRVDEAIDAYSRAIELDTTTAALTNRGELRACEDDETVGARVSGDSLDDVTSHGRHW
jgi:hypothetical protein